MRYWKIVILSILVSTITLVQAQQSTFIAVPKTWAMVPKSQIGANTRVVALDQNPYPFCFSYAASALFDQQRCMYNDKNCSQEPRTSALAATAAGQELTGLVDITRGGIGSLSLKHLIETGFVFDASCNYNIHDPKLPEYQNLLAQQISASHTLGFAKTNWQKYKPYTAYLERFYRKQFSEAVKAIRPNTSTEQINTLLNKSQTHTELTSELLLQPGCFTPVYQDTAWHIHTNIVSGSPKPGKVFNLINSRLAENRAVFTGICVANGGFTNNQCTGTLHAVVVIAMAKFKNLYTNDTRTAYWIVNTWGEHWQQQNSDGWVFAEPFIEQVTGEIIWLSRK